MHTFRQFLEDRNFIDFLYILEGWESIHDHAPDGGEYHIKDDHKDTHTHIHVDHEKGVKVHFEPRYGIKKKGHYDTSFSVNHSMSHKTGSDPHKNKAILHHVHRTIHDFIKKHKPKSIKIEASDTNSEKQAHKTRVYKKLANHLAKHYGGTAEHGATGYGGVASTVHFNH